MRVTVLRGVFISSFGTFCVGGKCSGGPRRRPVTDVVEFVVEALQPNRREGSDSKRSSRANGVSPSLVEL